MLRAKFLAALAAASISRGGNSSFAEIERRRGCALGVYAIDLASGKSLQNRENERFPLASTQKLPVVMAVLDRVDRGTIARSRKNIRAARCSICARFARTYENAANDVGLLFAPSGQPIAVACYACGQSGEHGGNAAIADCARLAVGMLRT